MRRLPILALAALAAGCSAPAAPAGAQTRVRARPFALGFTDFPHAFSVPAVEHAWSVIGQDGDLAVMHVDDGVPWEEARAGTPYAPGFQADLERKARALPGGHVVYLAVTPIAFARDGLAPHRGEQGNEPLRRPWDRRSFDDPEVEEAFVAHCERMLALYRPDYFAYAVEANMLAALAPRALAGLRGLRPAGLHANQGFPPAPARFPDAAGRLLPCRARRAGPGHHPGPAVHGPHRGQHLPLLRDADPSRLRGDHFSALTALAPGKPFAVAETAWPAEEVVAPYPTRIPASEARQQAYVERLLAEADRLSAVLVNWFFTRDYDDLWETHLRGLPGASLLRLWKDTGLHAGDGRARPALAAWRRVRDRRRR